MPTARQTLLVACGLARRVSRAEIAALVTPELRRRFHGRVVVHDAADPALAGIPPGAPRVRVAPELVETDLVVVVSAAETVLHGGPATLLAATDAETQRRATAESLLETRGSEGWRLATLVERTLAGARAALRRLARPQPPAASRACCAAIRTSPRRPSASRARRCGYAFMAAPESVRRRVLRSLRGHANGGGRARGTAVGRACRGAAPRDRAAPGEPRRAPRRARDRDSGHHALPAARAAEPAPRGPPRPRARARPVARRLPRRDGGIVILVHRFRRVFPRPTQQPYHVFFRSDPIARDPELLERRGGRGRRGRARDRGVPRRPHRPPAAAVPRLGGLPPRARAARRRLRRGRARRGRGAAARLRPDRRRSARRSRWPVATAAPTRAIGFLLAPPYFPLRVGLRRGVGRGRRRPRRSRRRRRRALFTETSRSRGRGAVEERHVRHCDSNVDHQRSPAASACCSCRASACGCVIVPLAGRDPRRAQPLAPQHRRLVEVDELGVVGKLELGERERQAAPARGGPAISRWPRKRASCSTTHESGCSER